MMKRLLILIVLGMVTAVLAACGSNQQTVSLDNLEMAPLSDMPQMVHEAPVRVQEAYQFAQTNKEVLAHIPCYCGCGSMGHTSNYSCFIAETEADGYRHRKSSPSPAPSFNRTFPSTRSTTLHSPVCLFNCSSVFPSVSIVIDVSAGFR